MKIQKRGVFRLAAVLLVVAVLLAGCAGNNAAKVEPPPPPPPKPVTVQPPPPPPLMPGERPKGPVSKHVWGALLKVGMEQRDFPGYAAYTYVLFNTYQQSIDSPEGKRYDAILRAVLLDVTSEKVGTSAGWKKDETNIFCIPFVSKNVNKDTAFAKYDFDTAKTYLAVLLDSVKNNADLSKRLKKRPGPFLITLYEPMPKLRGKAATSLLYLDLTDMPADGMREVLEAYQGRLEAGPLQNVEKLKESLKIIVLKYALQLDENLKIVNVAIAGIKK